MEGLSSLNLGNYRGDETGQDSRALERLESAGDMALGRIGQFSPMFFVCFRGGDMSKVIFEVYENIVRLSGI